MLRIDKTHFCWVLPKTAGCVLFVLFLLNSCTKDKPPIPDPVAPIQCWEKFEGTYMVYDTANGTSWSMIIEHVIDTNFAGEPDNFLKVTNFNNEFDFNTQFTCQTNRNSLSLGIIYPATNYNGKRYNLSGFNDDASTSIIENSLFNDTIIFYFRKENTLYWMPDGVSYEDGWHKHIAIKQH